MGIGGRAPGFGRLPPAGIVGNGGRVACGGFGTAGIGGKVACGIFGTAGMGGSVWRRCRAAMLICEIDRITIRDRVKLWLEEAMLS